MIRHYFSLNVRASKFRSLFTLNIGVRIHFISHNQTQYTSKWILYHVDHIYCIYTQRIQYNIDSKSSENANHKNNPHACTFVNSWLPIYVYCPKRLSLYISNVQTFVSLHLSNTRIQCQPLHAHLNQVIGITNQQSEAQEQPTPSSLRGLTNCRL
jgi:hypothetical protein